LSLPADGESDVPWQRRHAARDVMMLVEFDQRVDAARLLNTIKVRSGNAEIRVRLATSEEIEGEPSLRDLAKQTAEQGHWIAFRAIDAQGNTKLALPSDASITVSVEPGTASGEGHERQRKRSSFRFGRSGR